MTVREWGCPRCRGLSSTVIRSEHDEDGYRVRIRRCSNCGERWATEEVPITLTAFFARVRTIALRTKRLYQTATAPCSKCHAEYRRGFYKQHCASSKVHHAALTRPYDPRERRYARESARRRYRAKAGIAA